MTAETAAKKEGETSIGAGEPGLPTDFFVGVTLLCVSFFILILALAGVLGEPTEAGGGHGADPKAKHEAKEGDAEKSHGEETGHAGETAGTSGKGEEEGAAGAAGEDPHGVHLRKGAEWIDPAATKVVLLPCEIKTGYELGLSLDEISSILTEGCTKAFGGLGVPLDKIKARLSTGEFKGLSRHLATGAYRAFRHAKSFDLASDRFVPESKYIPDRVRKAVELADREGVVDFEVRYVFALTIVGMGPGEEEKKRALVMACLFDLEVKRIHSCIFYPDLLPAEKLPIQQRFAAIPGEAIERLLAKAIQKK
jgi:hypothetical protein